jgi:hypothetical protein
MEELPKLESTRRACSTGKRRTACIMHKEDKKASEQEQRESITITKCLTQPCPEMYTDSVSESIQIICRSPSHSKKKGDEWK